MPVCRCCCTDFYLVSDSATGNGADGAYRRVTMNNTPYPNQNIRLHNEPYTPFFGNGPVHAIDLRNKRFFTLTTLSGVWFQATDLRLFPIGGASPMPAGSLKILACDWSRRKIYYVTKITSVGPPDGDNLHTTDYEFLFWSMNYDGSDHQFIGSDSGSFTALGPTVEVNWIRWTPVLDRIYYGFHRLHNAAPVIGTDKRFAYIKWIAATGGGPTTIRTLEPPPGGDFTFDGAISTRQGLIAWIESDVLVGPPAQTLNCIRTADPDGGGVVTIRSEVVSPTNPIARFIHVSEKDNCLYYYQLNPFDLASTSMRLRKLGFDGTEFGTVFDTQQAGFNFLADEYVVSLNVAIGCGRDHHGKSYNGDG